MKRIFLISLVSTWLIGSLSSCEDSEQVQQAHVQCDADSGGLILPEGFCALIVADHIPFLRHIAVNQNGDIYGSRRNRRLERGGLVGIRDTDGDGKADLIEEITDQPGLGIKIYNGSLYFGAKQQILKYELNNVDLIPDKPAEIVVDQFPDQKNHSGKTFTFDQNGQVYINLGSPSNACQQEELKAGSKGIDPCPQRDSQAAIWKFDGNKPGQKFPADGIKYASGIRNTYALDWNLDNQQLYAVQHGRDGLRDLWPEIYQEQQGAELPAEEFLMINRNDDFGWPYCYYDPNKKRKVLAPEYGGDGEISGRCSDYKDPIHAFPAHYSPNDLLFYSGDQFPAEFHSGAFIAFHGSYNRGPYDQVGYQIVYLPLKDGLPNGESIVFADGFSGSQTIKTPSDAEFRPVGLAEGPDGSLYIADSVQGRIWRVFYQESR
ncbi:MAG: sorbosone dehydrogenase family protein [Gammaproteobacteria bacterium]